MTPQRAPDPQAGPDFSSLTRIGIWPESVLYDQSGSGGFIDRKKYKRGRKPFSPLGPPDIAVRFRDRQDRQIRGPQFRKSDYESPDAYRRWCRENGLAYQSLVNEISTEERRDAAK
jgi:hypothetical protein